MKIKFFLAAGLLTSAFSFAQTYSVPQSAGTNGANNVHVGEFAGSNSINSGIENVFVGNDSGKFNTIGGLNTFVGFNTGIVNTEGRANVFVGGRAGYFNTTGDFNTFLGYASGRDNTTGEGNTYVGYGSGTDVAIGTFSNYLGYLCGEGSSGEHNSYLGCYAAYHTAGSMNVFLGNLAGYASAGNRNVFLGFEAGKNTLGSNMLIITNREISSPLIYGEFDNHAHEPVLKFNANKVGIGPDFGAFPTLTFTNQQNYRLFVRGGILAEEVRIRLQADWADYVFADDYKLLSLNDTEKFIIENGHLPNMPSAAKVKEEGIEVGNIVKLQQEKIEELTLHLIKQNKQLEELKAQVQLLLKKQ